MIILSTFGSIELSVADFAAFASAIAIFLPCRLPSTFSAYRPQLLFSFAAANAAAFFRVTTAAAFAFLVSVFLCISASAFAFLAW